MTSPVRRHLERLASSAAVNAAVVGTGLIKADAKLSDYQSALAIDLERIKNETTLEGKARVKAVALPTYLGFALDYLEKGHNYPNDVAVQVMVWLLDVGDIERGLNAALTLIKQGQKMPARFNRGMAEFVCDFIYDWANEQLKAGHSASPYVDDLIAAAETDNWALNPLFLSKLYVILAKHKKHSGEYEQALALCNKAEAINPEKAGVKGLKTELKKLIDDAAHVDASK